MQSMLRWQEMWKTKGMPWVSDEGLFSHEGEAWRVLKNRHNAETRSNRLYAVYLLIYILWCVTEMKEYKEYLSFAFEKWLCSSCYFLDSEVSPGGPSRHSTYKQESFLTRITSSFAVAALPEHISVSSDMHSPGGNLWGSKRHSGGKKGSKHTISQYSFLPSDSELHKGSKSQDSGRAAEAPLRQILVKAAFV